MIDDNASNTAVVRRMTQGWGFRTGVAHDGETALRMALAAEKENDPYDLFLLDAEMPGAMDGFACAQKR